jgi:GTP-binding protein
MTDGADAAAEAARKLFAGACEFVWGATSAENFPPELNEVALSAFNAGKSAWSTRSPAAKAGARLQTPGATRQINFQSGGRPDAGGLAGLWFCEVQTEPNSGRR